MAGPNHSGPTRINPEHRFWQFVIVDDGNGGCWPWGGSKTLKGYGSFWLDGKLRVAHRWAYEHFIGPIPEGFQLDHLCSNRGCVRPDHLEPVTGLENVRRGIARRREAAQTTKEKAAS